VRSQDELPLCRTRTGCRRLCTYDWAPAHGPSGRPRAARYLAERWRWPNASTVARPFGSVGGALLLQRTCASAAVVIALWQSEDSGGRP
jgi:hypothetical protein